MSLHFLFTMLLLYTYYPPAGYTEIYSFPKPVEHKNNG